jgi:hypothetical protein
LERHAQAQEEILQARQRQETAQQDPILLSDVSFAQAMMLDSGNGKQQHSLALFRALQ